MRVRLLVSFSGNYGAAGSEKEVDNAEAQRLFAKGFAEPVKSTGVERAVAPPVERAVTRSEPKPKRRKVKKK